MEKKNKYSKELNFNSEAKRNFIDYIKKEKRTFDEYPLNEIDSLIFAWISYLQIPKDVVKELDSNPISLNKLLSKEKVIKNIDKLYKPKKSHEFFKSIKESKRFKDITVCDFVSKENLNNNLQYGSTLFNLPDGIKVIGYKGTNSTMNGWNEDLDMCFEFPIPSQEEALIQTTRIMNKYPNSKFILTGHSKGGNLAVYSGTFIDEEKQKNIISIYSHDGPGFLKDYAEKEEYLRVKDKIHKFIPQSSVFGLLLEYTTNYKTIQSNGFLVYQHSPFTWLVDIKKNIFIPSPSLTKIATLFSKTTSSWMNTFSIEERERAIKLVFGIIMDNKIQTSKDLKKHIPQVIISISKLDESDKEFVKEVLKAFFSAGINQVSHEIKANPKIKKIKTKKSGN